MGMKEDQAAIREVLRDTIKLLCKNGLKYNTEFSIEGLLGITIDNHEIFLVNINETFSQPVAMETEKQTIQHVGPETAQCHSTYRVTSPKSSVTFAPYNRNSFGRRTMGYTYSGLKKMRQRTSQSGHNRPPKIWLTDVTSYSDTGNQCREVERDFIEKSRTGEFSGEEALQRLADCVGRIKDSPSLSCSSSNKESLLDHDSQDGFSIKDSQYGFSIKDSQNRFSTKDSQDRFSTKDSQDGISIKEEILSDSQIDTCVEVEIAESEDPQNFNSLKRHNDTSNRYLTEHSPTSTDDLKSAVSEDSSSISWFSPPEGAMKSVFPVFGSEHVVTGGPVTPPVGLVSPQMSAFPTSLKEYAKVVRGGRFVDLEVRDRLKEAECEHAGMRAPGCIIIPRILCRAKGFKVGHVMNAMKTMTRSRDDPLYVGEYKQISGNMKTFYKCPPDLIRDEALRKYELSRDTYTKLYYENPRPKLGGPVNWANYVEILMRHMPLGPQHYPVESMGLTDVELRDLQLKQTASAKLNNSDYYACTGKSSGADLNTQ